MRPSPHTERRQAPHPELGRTLLQRLIGRHEQKPQPKPQKKDEFDTRDLAQRVRESGEW